MKLVTKLTLAFALVSCGMLVLNGYVRVQREVELFHADRQLDHKRIGLAIAQAAAAVRKSNGPEAAHQFIEETRARDDGFSVRWVCDADFNRSPLLRDCEEMRAIPEAAALSKIAVGPDGDHRIFTYVPLPDESHKAGIIEISEPTREAEHFTRQMLADSIVYGLTMAIAFALTAFVLGVVMIGRPTSALIAFARRIGKGELDKPLVLGGKDELSSLATEMTAMAGQIRDATVKATEQTAARITTLEQLRHADRLTTVGRLASGLAHELGTPLNVIEVRASMIADGDVTGQAAADSAKAVLDACERITGIVRKFLTFARKRTLEHAPTDIARLARQSVAMIVPLAQRGNVEFVVSSDDDVVADVDEIQVQQVLTNLLMNAVQAMPKGGIVEVTIRLEARPPDPALGDGPFVHVSVADEGVGIAADDIPELFDPFFTTKDVGQGTGLGLSIAYGIVTEHKGRITVASEHGRGTVFDIYLPVRSRK